MTTIPTLLPLPEAARKYGLDETRLKAMIQHGKIKAAMIMGVLVVDERTLPLCKEDLPEYKKFTYLKDTPIWLSEAERRYNIPHETILKWVKEGFIIKLGKDGNKLLLDEADVAYCAEIYKKAYEKSGGKIQGRRIFDRDGMPYKPKTGPLAV